MTRDCTRAYLEPMRASCADRARPGGRASSLRDGSLALRLARLGPGASLENVPNARTRVAELREIGFGIAVDDLGAGYAGFTTFAQLEPEYVKLDMSLV